MTIDDFVAVKASKSQKALGVRRGSRLLFADYRDTGYEEFACFGADLRAPIILAGRTQTLLTKMTSERRD